MPSRKRIPPLTALFAPGGRLSRALPAYEHRPEQVEACLAVEEALKRGKHCLVEAGTGVGKSLAYLIPAVLAVSRGKRTVVSTYTIGLQTQLMEKDIPLVLSLLPEIEVKAVLMKGRGNYLCRQDLDAAEADLFHAADPLFLELKRWSRRTDTGDVADLPFVYPNWHEVAANQDTCRHQECRYYDRCFYYRMRWNAGDANLIVVNHALFLSDLALRRSDPQSAILPEYDYVIFDEAHHLEDVATRVFGVEVNSRRIAHFVERVRRLRDRDINLDRLEALETASQALFSPFQSDSRTEYFVKDILNGSGETTMQEIATQVCATLEGVQRELLEKAKEEEPPLSDRLQGMGRIAGRLREELHTLVFHTDPNYIRWGENTLGTGRKADRYTTLYYTPIEVGSLLQEHLWSKVESVVLTSATLANSGGFSYLRSRLGIPDDAIERVIGSPFNFKQQALLYVPAHLPPPPARNADDAYTQAVSKEIERVVSLTEGRVFLLFTSRRMLNDVYAILKERLPYPLFRQGEQPPAKLLDAFRESGNGCLFGTQTFWEGVDVQGEALSCVIIDRLPFAVPDSPITRARTEAISAAGGDWFNEFSVPQAQIRLKQGFGRLIRTRTDRGIVCILDTRLLHKRYGPEFVRYLPPASRASRWNRVEQFWKKRCLASADREQA